MEKFERSQLMDQLKRARENDQIQEDPEGFMTEKQIQKCFANGFQSHEIKEAQKSDSSRDDMMTEASRCYNDFLNKNKKYISGKTNSRLH